MKTLILCIAVLAMVPVEGLRSQSPRTVWDGVYTDNQASRGEAVFKMSCSSCHGPDEFKGDAFLGTWDGSTVFDFFSSLQATMPMDNPGSLKPEAYSDVVAYFFRGNAFPAGKAELPADPELLKLIRIERKK
jgi:S-disulfanyl-L-cysteine oxidoreductase SoxD